MRVIVQLSRTARQNLVDWRARIVQSRTGSHSIAQVLWDEIVHELARKGGIPSGTEKTTEVPATYQWRCSDDTVLRYSVFDDPGSLIRSAIRTILITSIDQYPPPEE